MKRSIRLANRIDELQRLNAFVEDTADKLGVSPATAMLLQLVLEEAFTNVVLYAFPDGGFHEVDIECKKEADELTMILIDDGVAYDPTLKADPDVSLPAEDRKIGGLGIFLIRKMTDQVSYRRAGDKNELTIVKRLA